MAKEYPLSKDSTINYIFLSCKGEKGTQCFMKNSGFICTLELEIL